MRATVIVLGDLARSPRMFLHARALADAGVDVDLVGFANPQMPSASPSVSSKSIPQTSLSSSARPARAKSAQAALIHMTKCFVFS